jgi:hypothetical protein
MTLLFKNYIEELMNFRFKKLQTSMSFPELMDSFLNMADKFVQESYLPTDEGN